MARIISRMATSSKRKSPAKRAQPAKLAPARSGPSAKPFLRFYHSAELRAKTDAVLSTLEGARDPAMHRDALANLAVELTNAGLDCYFIK